MDTRLQPAGKVCPSTRELEGDKKAKEELGTGEVFASIGSGSVVEGELAMRVISPSAPGFSMCGRGACDGGRFEVLD
jgi:hypothetical protein